MGTYCTTTSLDTLMVGTTFDTATTALAGQCITQAETEIQKYLSKRYDMGTSSALALTSTASTPPMVTTWCEWYSQGLMYMQMSRGGKESISRGKDLIKMVVDNLKQVAAYELDLLGADGSILNDKAETAYKILDANTDYIQTFDEGDPLGWEVDPDKIDEIDADKL